MATRYFKKEDPTAEGSAIHWIEMTGQEFYAFVNSSEVEDRRFIFMDDDIVIEANEQQFREWVSEKNHSNYLRRCETGIETLSLYSDDVSESGNGEDVLGDSVDIEEQALMKIRLQALKVSLTELDEESNYLLQRMFLGEKEHSERDLATEFCISQPAVHKRKMKILKKLKLLVIKNEKSQQYKVRGKNREPII
ncbi:hypothetical protein D7X33_16705 [Butyricicoccus sp. 1XD8-22]|nr:hypothetical protein D7X33_16705 [Butyricicoccus sp. 1XD8-22]